MPFCTCNCLILNCNTKFWTTKNNLCSESIHALQHKNNNFQSNSSPIIWTRPFIKISRHPQPHLLRGLNETRRTAKFGARISPGQGLKFRPIRRRLNWFAGSKTDTLEIRRTAKLAGLKIIIYSRLHSPQVMRPNRTFAQGKAFVST